MRGGPTHPVRNNRLRGWLALALLPMLSGCLGAAVIPILASGPLLGKRHVRAATPAPAAEPKRGSAETQVASDYVVTSLKELPPPGGTPTAPAEPASATADPWQQFFAFALAKHSQGASQSALLTANPPLDKPSLRDCPTPAPAVLIDLDDGSSTFDPRQIGPAPAGVPEGLARLRAAGIVIFWISRLPAARAADVAQALRQDRLDPGGEDQLLLIRNANDRKQLLRNDANADVCIVAIAGDQRDDFDELFDYLRHPEQAAGLDEMLGNGWFLVPPLDGPGPGAK